MIRRYAVCSFAPFYFFGIAQIFHLVTDTPVLRCLILVIAASVVISTVIGLFAVGTIGERKDRGYGLSAILVTFVPLAVYLAGFRILFQHFPVDASSFAVLVLVAFCVFLGAFHSVMLLLISESLVTLVLRMRRQFSAMPRR